MRKKLLCMLLLAGSLNAYSQGPLTKNWEILATTTTGALIGNTSLQTTIAYNKVTDKLYLPERNNKISILNPATGALSSPSTLTVLNTAPAWTQSFKYTKIRVTDDGVIYACNMTNPASVTDAATIYIYRWASESDTAPTTSAISITGRVGDSFAVTGTGVNTVIYLSGANNTKLFICKTTDGVTFTLDNTVTLGAASQARSSISAIPSSSDIWINAPSVEARRISIASTGTITSTSAVASSAINQIYANTEYIQEGSEKYLAVSGAVIGGSYNAATGLGFDFKLYKITNFTTPPTDGVTEVGTGKLSDVTAAAPLTFYQNTNAYADVAYKKNGNGTYTFYNLICNNGMAAYTTASTLPVSLTSFTAGLSNGVSKLNWTTASESNNRGFDVQRSTDGVEFASIGFVASKAVQGNSSSLINYSYEDKTVPAGTHYYRLKQIDLNGDVEYSTIRVVNNVLNELAVKIYPNPAQNTLTLSTPLSLKGASYTVYNMVGQDFIKGKADELTSIDVSTLMPGIYFIKVISLQNEVQSIKFVKQ
ncbi:T9SS type A sorting domain-containing protein [Pedobacter glucosidilyticus]|uniref:T9SS type A sorting domain-containing protein n=1 Tax=Pedobacter glucosidilyticus TaxID=1122941 RepID=UPI000401ACF1|nr:T9SS type A sorting domain-containing protein [Pedobacter glucosidilyticus]